MANPKVGLLPLYLELYDKSLPQLHAKIQSFYDTIAGELEKRGLDVVRVPICRVSHEFESAVEKIEASGADCVVTLHLAYSPSLESAHVLSATQLPIVVLDTTPTFDFSPSQNPAEIMFNHGIHGVQDMCNLLIRNGKRFGIEAGHWEKSDVLDRVVSWCRAAHAAKNIRTARIGLIGGAFNGMGDFAVSTDVLRSTIGVETVQCNVNVLRSLVPASNDPVVEAEMAEDRSRFAAQGVNDDAHRATTCAGIAVRRWIEAERLTGFSFNFLSLDKASGLPTVPFMEAGKAMARGKGYAGEGDVLTAALVGALASIYPETTFTEMFCPDWENESVFLSHMGEMNLDLAGEKPVLMEKDFPWTDAGNPVIAAERFKAGDAALVNLAPGPGDTYSLIISPVEMLGDSGEDCMPETIRGWFRPSLPLTDFLAEYSRFGGTHHLALVYGAAAGDIRKLGDIMGWKVVILDRAKSAGCIIDEVE
ncbi:MAG TPA: hypothetical protein VGK34_07305 [Armatimonadota bacterium]